MGMWIDLTALFSDRKYKSDTEWINIASCLNNLKEELFCTQCVKLLQFTSILNFTCPVQPFVIIRNKRHQQIFFLHPSCCISFCKYGSFRNVSLFPTICYPSELHGQTNKGTRTPWRGGFLAVQNSTCCPHFVLYVIVLGRVLTHRTALL